MLKARKMRDIAADVIGPAVPTMPTDLVSREETFDYPTDLSPMTAAWKIVRVPTFRAREAPSEGIEWSSGRASAG
jgi:hypothetical protein